MTTPEYVARIGASAPAPPTIETLFRLHRAHLLSVPFENLDIHRRRPIVLDLAAIYDKVVHRRRGGFCYELNGLFSWLLREMGFDVTLLSARVFEHGREGPEFDHLTLLVRCGTEWLADVGFGDSFLDPLRLERGTLQRQGERCYRLTEGEGGWILWEGKLEGEWKPCYAFTLAPRRLSDFAGMCLYHQTSPASTFTRQRLCSLATPKGRITLTDSKLIVTRDGTRKETELRGPGEFRRLLRRHFRMAIEDEEPPPIP